MNGSIQPLFDSSLELRLYCLQSLPSHLADSGQEQKFRSLLTNFDFIYAKLAALGPQSTIEDYDLPLSHKSPESAATPLNDDDPLRQIQRAVRISAHIVGADNSQLPGQLLARLSIAEAPTLQAMLNQVSQWRSDCWLRPMKASLASPTGPLVRILEAPDGASPVAVTPDGMQIVSGGQSHPLRVWDLTTGETVMTLHGYIGSVQAIKITPDGSQVVSAFSDEAIRIWDLKSGQLMRTLTGLKAPIVITPDGACFVAGSKDGTLNIWNLASGQLIRPMEADDDPVYAAVITPDGAQLVSTSENHSLKVWSMKTGKRIRTLEDRNHSQTAVAITPDGKHVVAAGDRTLRVWKLKTGKLVRTFKARAGTPLDLVITSDGNRAVSISHDDMKLGRTIQVWDLRHARLESTLEGHSGWVGTIAVSPDGRNVVSGSSDGTIRVWDLAKATAAVTSERHQDSVWSVATSLKSNWAVSTSMDQEIRLWDPRDGKLLGTRESRWGGIRAMAAIPGKLTHIVVGLEDGTLRILDLLPEWVQVEKVIGGHCQRVSAVAVNSDGTKVVSSSDDGEVKVWNLLNGNLIYTLKGHSAKVYAVALTPDGSRAVSSSEDKTIKVWDLRTGSLIHSLNVGDCLFGVAITPEGRRALSATSNFVIELWDIESGFPLRFLQGHTGKVYGLAVTPDGASVVSVSEDRTLRLWDLESVESLATSPELQFRMCLAKFTADSLLTSLVIASEGRTIVTGDNTGNVHFLNIVDNRFQKSSY